MNERERVISAVRRALEPLPVRAAYPEWDAAITVARCVSEAGEADDRALFSAQLIAAHGHVLNGPEALAAFLKDQGAGVGYVDPELLPLLGSALAGFQVETAFDRNRVDAYEFGITRASGGIAETGSLILTDGDTPARLAALAPWIHVAVLDPAAIFRTVEAAVATFGNDPSIIFVTGPSKTADIEGILIEGVHGPGIQACCFC
ncbi:MAG: LUD domain-containing protein [Opitutales bacterium]|nr:LUD domain-containing protein [Opitutales bacterium]